MSKKKSRAKQPNTPPPTAKSLTANPVVQPTPAREPQPWKGSTLFWIHLGIIAFVLLILRMPFLDLPLERDESAYAYLGKRAGEGLAIYRDFYEMKPPLLFYSYTLLNAIFGYSIEGLRWAAIVLSFLLCLEVYLIGQRLLNRSAGLIAALALAIFSSNPALSMVFAESELLVMAFALLGVWLLIRPLSPAPGPQRRMHIELLLAGLSLGTAVMIKQSAVFFLGFAAVALVLLAQGARMQDRLWKLFYKGMWFSLGAIFPVLLSLGIVLMSGTWTEFLFWNVEYPQLYTEDSYEMTTRNQMLQFIVSKLTQFLIPLWILAGLGALSLALKGAAWQSRLALLALCFFSLLAVTPGQRYYLHYWIQFIPAVALMVGLLFYQIEKQVERLNLQTARWFSLPLAAVSLFVIGGITTTQWRQIDSAMVMRDIFGRNPFIEDELLSKLIKGQMQPDETVAVLGSEPQVYVYLDRKAPTRHFYPAFLSRKHQYTEAWQVEALEGLISTKPTYVVFYSLPITWMFRPDSPQLFFQSSYSWVLEHYTPIAWIDYEDPNNLAMITGNTALRYQPKTKDFIMVMKRK